MRKGGEEGALQRCLLVGVGTMGCRLPGEGISKLRACTPLPTPHPTQSLLAAFCSEAE